MATILIVDDESHILELARLYLEKEGYAVETASSGPAGPGSRGGAFSP